MADFQVKKVVAVCFLEAAQLVLEHIGTFRLQLSDQGVPGPDDLPHLYGEVRRLRDFLQRCISAHQETVSLQLADHDAALLVACCRRAIEAIEVRLTDRVVAPDEKEWLQKKRTVLADWAHALAVQPLLELPLTRMSPVSTDFMRTLTLRLQNAVFGGVADHKRIAPPRTDPSIAQGLSPSGDSGLPREEDPAPPMISLADTLAESDAEAKATQEVAASAAARPATTPAPPTHAVPQPGARVRSELLDSNTLRDPRLRALAAMDLAAYERCLSERDYRLATVMLCSVLEAAVVDHAIPRRSELGISGSPDTWNPNELLLTAIGEAAQPKDRALAYHLFASRNLLRPSRQMVTPSVVTAASFERLLEFVRRALHVLGFVASSETRTAEPDAPGRPAG